MKLIAISDTHGYLPKIDDIPECDVICHCGDLVPLEYQNNLGESLGWFHLDFLPWIDNLPCKKFVFIAGNHDFFLQDLMYARRPDFSIKMRSPAETIKVLLPGNHKSEHSKLVYLRDNSVEIEDKRIYGTPWISGLNGWAFNKYEEELETDFYSKIPKKCDVLLTHMPPAIGEVGVVHERGANYGNDYSSYALAEVLRNRDVHYAFCGHVHSGQSESFLYEAQGDREHYVTNVSVKDERYLVKPQNYKIFEI